MSTSRGDLEQKFSIDLDPLVGLLRPSPYSSSGEQLGDGIEQSLPTPHDEESDEEKGWKRDLKHAVSGNKWSEAKEIIDQNPNALTAGITKSKSTALHVAAQLGHVTIVEELLKLLPPECIAARDSNGRTALALASWFSGITQIAKCLVDKNSDILGIPSGGNHLPVTVAFRNGHHEMGRYLYSVTPLEYLKGRWGSQLLSFCFREQCFGT
ncbi:uncharacterized protein LOC114721749 isoform X2 [Neltuma alba]|uniref:uncharacterized protein LOC114721749 isoform X2 n=1 Tax=Neltuma alba TaxID=207710 RepID=UPI0010A4C1BE|nr:uncharacterized protein LOC114721749 isoform X2 [Prosopis alba]